MNEWNNYQTLEHHAGIIWVSKTFQTNKRGNICMLQEADFRVLAYISPEQYEKKDFDSLVADTLTALGVAWMLQEDRITCSVCGKSYNEGDVNIVDYDDDVCVTCEKTYPPQQDTEYKLNR